MHVEYIGDRLYNMSNVCGYLDVAAVKHGSLKVSVESCVVSGG